MNAKLRWRCGKGHVWKTTPAIISGGSWCPKCHHDKVREAKKLTLERMWALAKERGGRCLSKEYLNKHEKLLWECKNRHRWEAVPRYIRRGSWCPKCARAEVGRRAKLTIEEMQEIARSRGGECLSKKYVDSQTKLKWKCREDHVWEAVPSSIKRGRWCPICSRAEVGRSKRLTIGEMRKIARSRGGECLSKRYVDSQTKLKWRCSEGHVWKAEPNGIKQGTWCPRCHITRIGEARRLTIREMRKIARSRGGKCLSKSYVDSKTKLKWKCGEGHVWEAEPGNIKRGTWCPRCSRRWSDRRKRNALGKQRKRK